MANAGSGPPRWRGSARLDFEHGLGQLFQKQRDAVSLLDHLVDGFGRQATDCRELLDHGPRLGVVQAVDRDRCMVRAGGPWRHEAWPKGDQHEDRPGTETLDRELQQLHRAGVAPMRILEHQQRRPPAGEALELRDQRLLRLLALGWRCQLQCGIALGSRDRQQSREQGCGSAHLVGAEGHQPLQLVELLLGAILAVKAGRALELVDDRVERAARIERRATTV